MKNRKIVIVGGTDGIGRALAEKLVKNNEVLIIGRSEEKGKSFVAANGPNARYLTTDLSLLRNIAPLTNKIKSMFDAVDFIVHTADIIRMKRMETQEGLEISIVINYYARVLFNQLMTNEEKAYTPERIIHVAAAGFPPSANFMDNFPLKPTVSSFKAHTLGQWCNDFYGLYMKDKLLQKGTKINILNPGNVSTDIRKKGQMPKFLKLLFPIIGRVLIGKSYTPEEYAEIPLRIMQGENSAADEFTLISRKGKGIKGNTHVNNQNIQKQLYEFTTDKINEVLNSRVESV